MVSVFNSMDCSECDYEFAISVSPPPPSLLLPPKLIFFHPPSLCFCVRARVCVCAYFCYHCIYYLHVLTFLYDLVINTF